MSLQSGAKIVTTESNNGVDIEENEHKSVHSYSARVPLAITVIGRKVVTVLYQPPGLLYKMAEAQPMANHPLRCFERLRFRDAGLVKGTSLTLTKASDDLGCWSNASTGLGAHPIQAVRTAYSP